MRSRRVFYDGAVCHVFSRGNNQAPIFLDDQDREAFLNLLWKVRQEYGLRFYAYVLMTNHYHLVVETPEPNLDKAMQRLNQGYTRHFNQRHGRTGHLFESRYKCRLVQKDRYLLALVRYLHLNPVKAGMVESPSEYSWSSHNDYLLSRGESLVEWPAVLRILTPHENRAPELYAQFMAAPIKAREWKALDRKRNGILGDAAFRTLIRAGHGTHPSESSLATSASNN